MFPAIATSSLKEASEPSSSPQKDRSLFDPATTPVITADTAIPNTAFGLGFWRCEEVREAGEVAGFLKNYEEKSRDTARKERFKVAYEEEVVSETRNFYNKNLNAM